MSKAELETVFGMINYLKQYSGFAWDANHDKALQDMKNFITQHPGPVLSYIDPQKEQRLQFDALTAA